MPFLKREIFLKYPYDQDLRGCEGISYARMLKYGSKVFISPLIVRNYDQSENDLRLSTRKNSLKRGRNLMNGHIRMLKEFYQVMTLSTIFGKFLRIIYYFFYEQRLIMKVLIVFSSKDIGAEKSITIMSHFIKKNISDEFFLSSIGGEGEWSKWARSIKLNPILSNPGKGNIKDMFSMWKIIKTLEPDLVYVMGLRLSLFFRILKFFYKENFFINTWNSMGSRI